MTVAIRILGHDDGGVLHNIAPEVFDAPIDETMADVFLRDPRHILGVAIDDGLVVGFVSAVCYVHPDKPAPELWINEVGVAPTHHRRGIGKQVLQAVLDEGNKRGCRDAWVLTDRDNTAAMGLYASVGGTDGDHVMFTFSLESRSKEG